MIKILILPLAFLFTQLAWAAKDCAEFLSDSRSIEVLVADIFKDKLSEDLTYKILHKTNRYETSDFQSIQKIVQGLKVQVKLVGLEASQTEIAVTYLFRGKGRNILQALIKIKEAGGFEDIRKRSGQLQSGARRKPIGFKTIQTIFPERVTTGAELENLLRQPLSSLNLPFRAANCLRSAKVEYVGDVVIKSETQIWRIRHFGRQCMFDLKTSLAQLGLHLNMDVKDWPYPDLDRRN